MVVIVDSNLILSIHIWHLKDRINLAFVGLLQITDEGVLLFLVQTRVAFLIAQRIQHLLVGVVSQTLIPSELAVKIFLEYFPSLLLAPNEFILECRVFGDNWVFELFCEVLVLFPDDYGGVLVLITTQHLRPLFRSFIQAGRLRLF